MHGQQNIKTNSQCSQW